MVDFKKALAAAKNKKPVPGRLPVAEKNAAPALAGRGGEKLVASVRDFGKRLDGLEDLAAELVEINRQKKELEDTADTIRGAIRDMMQEVKADESWTVRSEDTAWVATYVVCKDSKKLVPELLIMAGVTDKQLKKGYKVVPAKKPYVTVRTAGEKTRENEEHE